MHDAFYDNIGNKKLFVYIVALLKYKKLNTVTLNTVTNMLNTVTNIAKRNGVEDFVTVLRIM